MLPGTGLGGYATSGGMLCRSRYTRFEPVPSVCVIVGDLNRDGRELERRAGNAGL